MHRATVADVTVKERAELAEFFRQRAEQCKTEATIDPYSRGLEAGMRIAYELAAEWMAKWP